jgi:hypothetical protein
MRGCGNIAGMTEHSANLTAAIADLKRRRAEIDSAIQSMETVLKTVYGVAAPAPARTHSDSLVELGVERTVRRGASRAERVRRAFAENDPTAVWTAETLAVEIGETTDEGTVKAIHGILSRMRKAGLIVKLERGEYAATDTSGPDVSGPEADDAATDAGGDSLVQIDNDHGVSPQTHHRDDRGGASVVDDLT